MYHKKFSIFCFFIFFLIFSKQIYAYQQDIVEKYDNIFSSKVLSDEDVYNYQQAYKFQEKCKWKSANNFILKIRKEIFISKKSNINIKEFFLKLKKEALYKKFNFLAY